MTHDTLCPCRATICKECSYKGAWCNCRCTLISNIRADEREKAIDRVAVIDCRGGHYNGESSNDMCLLLARDVNKAIAGGNNDNR